MLAALLLPFAAAPTVLDAGERESLALICDAPSDVLSRIGALLHQHTDLAPIELSTETIEGCGGAPICIALRARDELHERSASFLAFVAAGSGKISGVLIDLTEAIRCADAGGDDETLADCAAQHALVATSLGHPDADSLVREVFRPALERSGHWEPYGSIAVEIAPRDAVISLDGKPLGRIDDTARVEGVRPGQRKLVFEHPQSPAQEVGVEVKRGELAAVSVAFPVEPPLHPARTITIWSGAAVGAIGVGLLIWAAVASANDSSVAAYCFGGDDCPTRFRTFSQLTDDEGDHSGLPHGGVLAIPLGYSIAGAGATFSLGALLIGDDDELPWIAWIAGAVVGGLAYGISAALN